jgi:hypothetical protein
VQTFPSGTIIISLIYITIRQLAQQKIRVGMGFFDGPAFFAPVLQKL